MKATVFAATVVLLLATLGACRKAEESASDTTATGAAPAAQTVKVVAILPLTGGLAAVGTPKKEAMELAAAEAARLSPGVKLAISYEDSAGDPTQGIAALNKAVSIDGIKTAFVDLTTVVDASIPVADAAHVLMFAGSAAAGITDQSKTVFRVFPGGNQEVKLISDYLSSSGTKTIFMLHTNEVYGRSVEKLLRSTFAANGGRVVDSQEYALSAEDFRIQLLKAKRANADKIVLLGYGVEYAKILKQASEVGIPSSKLVSNLGAVNAGVLTLDPKVTEGMVFAGPAFNLRMGELDKYPQQKALVDGYKAKYGKTPDFRVAFVYDTILLLAKALEEGKSVEGAVEKLMTVRDYEGASGRITIQANRDAKVDMVLATYRGGKVVALADAAADVAAIKKAA